MKLTIYITLEEHCTTMAVERKTRNMALAKLITEGWEINGVREATIGRTHRTEIFLEREFNAEKQ